MERFLFPIMLLLHDHWLPQQPKQYCHLQQNAGYVHLSSGLTYRTSPTLFSGMQKGVEGQKGDFKKNERRAHVKV